jgi:periodic tryptophan protein 2
MIFDPVSLTEEITPGAVRANIRNGNFGVALLISLHLNEFTLVREVLEDIPYGSIPHVVKAVGPEHLERLMQFLSKCMLESPHLEFYLQFCLEMLRTHGIHMEKHRSSFMRAFRSMHRSVQIHHDELKRLCDDNRYTLEVMEDQTQIVLSMNAASEETS